MTLALKIYNHDRELIGYLLADLRITPFLHFFKDQREKSEVYVLTATGELIKGTTNEIPDPLFQDIKKLAPPANYYITRDKLNLCIPFAIPYSSDMVPFRFLRLRQRQPFLTITGLTANPEIISLPF